MTFHKVDKLYIEDLHTITKDGIMNGHGSGTVRKGQFLWMKQPSQKNYLKNLKEKITSGFFNSDCVIAQIVDEIAPVLEDVLYTERHGS